MVLEFGWFGSKALAELTGDSNITGQLAPSVHAEFPRDQHTYHFGNRRYHVLPLPRGATVGISSTRRNYTPRP